MLSVQEINDCFKFYRDRILHFMDFEYSLDGFIVTGLFFPPNFLMLRSVLIFVQCIQTRFTVRILAFISAAMILELMLLVFALIMYLTLAAVSFKTLFFLPLPISP